MNGFLTSNDLALHGICPNLLSYEDRFSVYSGELVKYNMDINRLMDEPVMYLNCLTYKVFEEFFNDTTISLKRLENLYNRNTFPLIELGHLEASHVAQGWVRFCAIYSELEKILVEYDECYPNIEYSIPLHKTRLVFRFKIDLLLRKKDDPKIDLLTIVPRQSTGASTQVVSNIDTLMALDYIYEAQLPIGKVIEVSYDRKLLRGNNVISIRNAWPNSGVEQLVKIAVNTAESRQCNIYYCNQCEYRRRCSLTQKVNGREVKCV